MSRLSENFHLAAVHVFCFLLILRNLQSASDEDVICAKDEIEHLNDTVLSLVVLCMFPDG